MSTNTSMSNNAGGSNSGNLQISGGNDNSTETMCGLAAQEH
jgi:hypothetical protein